MAVALVPCVLCVPCVLWHVCMSLVCVGCCVAVVLVLCVSHMCCVHCVRCVCACAVCCVLCVLCTVCCAPQVAPKWLQDRLSKAPQIVTVSLLIDFVPWHVAPAASKNRHSHHQQPWGRIKLKLSHCCRNEKRQISICLLLNWGRG